MRENIEDQILKEFVDKQKKRLSFLGSKWKILIIIFIIGALLGLLITFAIVPKYNAALSFVLSNESKSSGLSGLASQFGMDLGNNGGNDVFAGDNILTLFKSEKMLKEVLFKKPPTQNDILANIIVKEWKWDNTWKKNKRTADAFPFPIQKEQLTGVHDSLLREVYKNITDNYLSVARTDKKLNVYLLNTISTNEIFACYLTKYLMDETANFYIETKTSISKRNLAMLQKEADSLRFLLGRNITTTAAAADRTFNLNTALQVERATTQKNQANTTVIGTAYGEVIKNLAIAKITLQKETPLYQIIDVPYLPLKKIVPSKLIYAAIGGGTLCIITCIILLSVKPKDLN